VFVSLAGLTKLTGLLILLPIVIVLLRNSADVASFGRRMGTIVGSWFIFPLLFLIAGYNFVAQYLFTIYKLTIDKLRHSDAGGRPAGSPADALNNELVGLFGTLYNGRWINVVLLALVGVFVVYMAWNRSDLADQRNFVAAALLTAFLPFAVWVVFAAGTLSRHTIVLLVPFGYVSLAGLDQLVERSASVSRETLVRFGQVAVAISVAQLVINI